MEEVIRIIEQIQATNSKNEKLEIIKANADNELFKKTLRFLLDGNVVTGISKKKISKKLSAMSEELSLIDWGTVINNTSEWESCINYLSLHNTGTDSDIRIVQRFITDQPAEYHDFYIKMITKTLKLGCDSKTVNKAIPGLIPTWDVMLGSGQDKLKFKDGEYFYISQKLNGNRCSYNGAGKLLSRQGKEFKGFEHIISDIEKAKLSNWFVDGELTRKNTDNVSDGENFRIGTGITNSDAEKKEEIKLVIFDMFPAEELMNKKSTMKYSIRKLELEALRLLIEGLGLQNIEVVEMLYEGTDQSKIDELLEYAVERDWEGLMINKDVPYECKRTTGLVKIKRFYEYDLQIVDLLEGDGRLKGTLGALVVQYKNNTVNVGTGFDDVTRKEFWNRRDELIGRVISVKFKEETSDKNTGLPSLQFPVFVRLREEGKEVSHE